MMQNNLRHRARAHHRARNHHRQGHLHKISSNSRQASHLLDESKEAQREWENEYSNFLKVQGEKYDIATKN